MIQVLQAPHGATSLGVGSSPFEAVYAELHYLVGLQNGSRQVHLQKARSHWEDSSVAGSIVRIRYCLLS